MFDWTENKPLDKGLKYWAYSCSSLQIKSRKFSIMCDIAKCRGGTVNRMSIYAVAAVRSDLYLKHALLEIAQNSQENICAGILFLIKLNSVDLQLH